MFFSYLFPLLSSWQGERLARCSNLIRCVVACKTVWGDCVSKRIISKIFRTCSKWTYFVQPSTIPPLPTYARRFVPLNVSSFSSKRDSTKQKLWLNMKLPISRSNPQCSVARWALPRMLTSQMQPLVPRNRWPNPHVPQASFILVLMSEHVLARYGFPMECAIFSSPCMHVACFDRPWLQSISFQARCGDQTCCGAPLHCGVWLVLKHSKLTFRWHKGWRESFALNAQAQCSKIS